MTKRLSVCSLREENRCSILVWELGGAMLQLLLQISPVTARKAKGQIQRSVGVEERESIQEAEECSFPMYLCLDLEHVESVVIS